MLKRNPAVAVAVAVAIASVSAGCQKKPATTAPPVKVVDAARLVAADQESGWLTHGRTYSEQRYSPLTQITTENVKDLGLAWSLDLDTNRGQEATPLVVDGVMYSTSAWSKVQAIDRHDRQAAVAIRSEGSGRARRSTPAATSSIAASRSGRASVYVGTLDGRLVALDAEDRHGSVVGA